VNLIWSKYYANGDVPGKLQGSFWWKSHLKLIDLYKGMARCNLGDGRSALFWTDLWHDSCLHQKSSHTWSPMQKEQIIQYQKFCNMNIFRICSTYLCHKLPMRNLSNLRRFVFKYKIVLYRVALILGHIFGEQLNSQQKKAYSVMMGHNEVINHFSWLWKSSCQPRHKFFFWLLLHDRLNTKNLLGRKNFHLQNYDYVCIL
jgi:hypothetical protein